MPSTRSPAPLPAWRPRVERYRGEKLAEARIEYLHDRLKALNDEVRVHRDFLAELGVGPWALLVEMPDRLAGLRRRLFDDPEFRRALGCEDRLCDDELESWESAAEVSARMLRDLAAERGRVSEALDEATRRHRQGLPPLALPRLVSAGA